MSWQDDAMIEQERADALEYMGEAEWRGLEDKAKQTGEWELTTQVDENNEA